MINRERFYDAYRDEFGSLKQSTVDTLEAILRVFDSSIETVRKREKMAYMLATVRHECGPEMKPIIENMNYSQERIKVVWPKRPEAVKYGSRKHPYKKAEPEALANSVYANRLGNGPPSSGDGYKYRGRGIGAQFTGKVNYEKFSKLFNVDLVGNPDLALDLNLGAKILYKGSMEGLFTGKALDDYITPSRVDYVNARRVVNDDVGLNGARVATLAKKFEKILKEAGV